MTCCTFADELMYDLSFHFKLHHSWLNKFQHLTESFFSNVDSLLHDLDLHITLDGTELSHDRSGTFVNMTWIALFQVCGETHFTIRHFCRKPVILIQVDIYMIAMVH